MKHKCEWHKLMPLAERLRDRLASACDRIEIAGSLRRGCQYVSDVELVAVPKLETVSVGFFSNLEQIDQLVEKCEELERSGVWQSDPPDPFTKKARGQKYRRYYQYLPHEGVFVPVDLFLVRPPASWGVLLLIRTGPASFSKWMVTQRRKGGALPDEYQVRDGSIWCGDVREPQSNDAQIPIQEEQDWFDLAGLPYFLSPGLRFPIEPEKGERYCLRCLGPWRPEQGCWCLKPPL